jgi:hypothetical protein
MKTHRHRRSYSLASAIGASRRVRESKRPDYDPNDQSGLFEAEIERFASSLITPVLYQNGSRIGTLEDLDLRIEPGNRGPILSFQFISRRVRRKILDIVRRDYLLEIQVEHFNQKETFEIRELREVPSFGFAKNSRKSFQQCLEGMILRNFPEIRILRSVVHSDLEHSLSGRYVRMLLRSAGQHWASLAVSPLEDQTTVDGLLSQGLIWLDYLRQHYQPSRLLLLVPQGRGQVLKSRLKWIRGSSPKLFLLEIDVDRESLAYVDLSDSGNVDTGLTRILPFRTGQSFAQSEEFKRLLALSPRHVKPVYRPDSDRISFRVRGLEFAILHLRGSQGVTAGVGEQSPVRTDSDWKLLAETVNEIVRQRQWSARNTRCIFYRLQAERWLESLILQDIQLIDSSLDPRHVYPQVPAFLGTDRGMIDILSITREGRLAVLELKVSEDIELPVQGLDYWLRVRWHQLHQEFLSKGYFRNVAISPDSPVLFFVSPQFRYHDTFPRIVKHISPLVPLVQVGINEDWRSGVRVVMKRKFNLP